jgi:two-component sensor histidine kinase
MIGENRPISLKVSGEGGSATSRQAESLGLITTELVINSLKYAFSENTKDGAITVAYDVSGTDWKLSIADNGVGKPDGVFAQPKTGLGTGIVKALRNSSVPRLKLWLAQRERPCRSLTPLSWQRCPVSCERRGTSIEQQTKMLHARADEVR